MNEAYLNLGFPIILRKDEFKQVWSYYYCIRKDYTVGAVSANTPNEAIEYMMNTFELTPVAMHFYERYVHVDLYFILKH